MDVHEITTSGTTFRAAQHWQTLEGRSGAGQPFPITGGCALGGGRQPPASRWQPPAACFHSNISIYKNSGKC